MPTNDITALIGKTLSRCEKAVHPQWLNDEIRFWAVTGEEFCMSHYQDCCESVDIEDINGDLEWLVGTPILSAYESTMVSGPSSESQTWTFYRIATARGVVVIRWYGTSNGYYSETVSFDLVTPPVEPPKPAYKPILPPQEDPYVLYATENAIYRVSEEQSK